jgi:thymidylate synthase
MKQYLDMLRHIKENGRPHSDRTGVTTKRVFGYQNRYDLDKGFPLLTTKKLAFRWIAEELLWFLSGDTNNKTLQDKGITIWDGWATEEQCKRFGREENDLGAVYGQAWRNFGATERSVVSDADLNSKYDDKARRMVGREFVSDGVDQIRRLCDLLANNPDSRRMIVSGWNPAQCDNVALPPCHTLFHMAAEEQPEGPRKLHCQLYQRSADVFLGVPYNIASYGLLTIVLAHVHDMVPGDFVHTFGDLHIYANHFDQVDEQLSREPRPSPTVVIDESLRGKGFDGLMDLRYEHMSLESYDPWPKIAAPVAI